MIEILDSNEMTNPLRDYFDANHNRIIHKWDHYFDIYHHHFSRFIGKEVAILEIGVFQGGSLQMWKNYFGDKARIYGVDVDPDCKRYEEESIEIFIGSQSDRAFLRKLKQSLPMFDIVLDDGGHTMNQMSVSFHELYDHVKPDGIYAIEDMHTCYWPEYGGGWRRRGSFMEEMKSLIDSINAWHSRQSMFRHDKFTPTLKSLHYYDSLLMIEKRPITKPFWVASGTRRDGEKNHFEGPSHSTATGLVRKLGKRFNYFLAMLGLPSIPRL